ncbi:MAG: SseB family protein [Nocardioides sp.]|uniref:SseB family protein n=1 Tax=Nocardioides sp. TaxID=35761 RepID=UPI00262748D3|nr:SseB family protein [Nocardioides sp.]MCW2834449.1 SseB family protein [Nocardioides sp.]
MDNGVVERLIPDPGFAGDTGTADPALAAALAAYAEGETTHGDALLVLQDARLLVPVVAMLGEVEIDERGLAHDKTSDMAVVLVRRPDGRVGLLAFTSTHTLARWNSEARPVPVAARLAARAAVQEEAAALVIDIAGPATYVIEGDDLTALAAGWRLTPLGDGTAWIGPAPE